MYRQLTCHTRDAQSVLAADWRPELRDVVGRLRSLDFVAINAFLHESLCVLQLSTSDLSPPRSCGCAGAAPAERHITHGTDTPQKLPSDPTVRGRRLS